MNLAFNGYSFTLFLSGSLVLFFAVMLYDRQHKFILWFFLLMVSTAMWAIFYAFELSSTTLGQMQFFVRLQYIGISFLPAIWIVFIIHLIQRPAWLNSLVYVAVFLVPVLTIIMVNTNEWHHLHYAAVQLDEQGPFPMLSIHPGPWYYLHMAYFYVFLVLGLVLLLRFYSRSAAVFRKQLRLILLATIVPWVANILYQTGVRPYEHIDLTPFSFVITALIIGVALFRYKLFAVVPYVREKLMENIHEGVLIVDAAHRVIDMNQAMRNFLGHASVDPVGELFLQVFPNQHGLYHLLLRQSDGKAEVAIGAIASEKIFEVSVTALRDKRQNYIGSLLLFWDVTSLKQSARQLQEQAEQLKSLNEVKTRMFSIVSHDLRSPFASLRGFFHLIETGMLSEKEVMELVSRLSKDVSHTSSLLDNLLYWSKSQLRGEVVNAEKFAFKAMLQLRLTFFEKRATEKKILLVDHVLENVSLYADRDMIDFVLRNLLSNAIKFCREGDRIDIHATTNAGLTEIVVRDNGVGMEPEILNNVFTFSMTSREGTAREKGTGLGLALCKEFITKNNGEIWAESEPGKGSAFFVRLPGEPNGS